MDRRTSPLASLFGSIAALGLGLFLATLLLVVLSPDPGQALFAFYLGPFSSTLALGSFLNQGALLILTGLGVSAAFSAGSFNLGGEGQVYLGALAALVIGLILPPQLSVGGTLLILTAALTAGALLAGLSGGLKVATGADDLITTFLLSAACLPLVDFFITFPQLSDKNSYLITTLKIDPAFWIPFMMPPSKLHWGALLAIPLAAGLFILLFKTTWGYKLRMTGRAPAFAAASGFNLAHYTLWPLMISGGLHGLAGGLAIAGTHHALIQSFSFGLGWNGISAALIARNHPLMVIPAGLFLAYLDQASRSAMIRAQFPFELSLLIQAIILLFITAGIFVFGAKKRTTP